MSLLGNSANIGLGFTISLVDRFSAPAGTIARRMGMLDEKAMGLLDTFGSFAITAGAVTTAVGYGMTRAFSRAVKEAGEFQNHLISIKAMAEKMDDGAIKDLGNNAMVLAEKYGISSQRIVKAYEEAVKAGMETKAQMDPIINAAVASSLGSSEHLEGERGVAARFIDIMMAFRKMPSQAMEVADMMNTAAIKSTTSWDQLAKSLEYSQDVFHNLKIPLHDALALLALMGNMGIKASIAGTSSANMMREIARAAGGEVPKKTKALASIGLKPKDLQTPTGDILSLLDLLTLIKKHTQGLPSLAKQNIMQALFGTRGGRGANPALDLLYDEVGADNGPTVKDRIGMTLEEFMDAIKNSKGTTERLAKEKMESYQKQVERFNAATENLRIAVGQNLLPFLTPLVKVLTLMAKFVGAIVKIPIIGPLLTVLIAGIGGLLIPIGLAVTGIGLLTIALSQLGIMAQVKAGASWAGWLLTGMRGTNPKFWGKASGSMGMRRDLIDILSGDTYRNAQGNWVRRTARPGVPMFINTAKDGRGVQGWLFKLGSRLAFAVPWLGRLAAMFLRLIPIVGWVITIFSILTAFGVDLSGVFKFLKDTIKLIINNLLNALDSLNPFNWFKKGPGFFRNKFGYSYELFTALNDTPGGEPIKTYSTPRGIKDYENQMNLIQRYNPEEQKAKQKEKEEKTLSLNIHVNGLGEKLQQVIKYKDEQDLAVNYNIA